MSLGLGIHQALFIHQQKSIADSLKRWPLDRVKRPTLYHQLRKATKGRVREMLFVRGEALVSMFVGNNAQACCELTDLVCRQEYLGDGLLELAAGEPCWKHQDTAVLPYSVTPTSKFQTTICLKRWTAGMLKRPLAPTSGLACLICLKSRIFHQQSVTN